MGWVGCGVWVALGWAGVCGGGGGGGRGGGGGGGGDGKKLTTLVRSVLTSAENAWNRVGEAKLNTICDFRAMGMPLCPLVLAFGISAKHAAQKRCRELLASFMV